MSHDWMQRYTHTHTHDTTHTYSGHKGFRLWFHILHLLNASLVSDQRFSESNSELSSRQTQTNTLWWTEGANTKKRHKNGRQRQHNRCKCQIYMRRREFCRQYYVRFHFSLFHKMRVFPRFSPWSIIIQFCFSSNLVGQFQKMNFSPFTTQFTGLPANSSLHQFTTAKFAQNLTTSNGQVSFHSQSRSTNDRILLISSSTSIAIEGGQFGVGRRW